MASRLLDQTSPTPAALRWALALVVLALSPQLRMAQASAASANIAGAGAAEDAQLFLLRDGRTLWGGIEAHDEQGIEVRRLIGGGLIPLAWSFLDPSQESALRLRLGYVDSAAEEVSVDADRIVLHDGTELIGRIENRTEEYLWIKRASGTLPIAKVRIATTSIVRAPALDVYTREELYQRRSAELAAELVQSGQAGAQAHIELAQYAERLFDFAHALDHYRIAQALDATHRSDLVSAALTRTQEKAGLQEQVDILAQADLWRARGQYERAFQSLADFPDRFPGTPLLADWVAVRERIGRSQERELRETVVQRWHYWSAKLARDAAREIASFEAARDHAQERLGGEVMARVHADLTRIAPAIQMEEVRGLWEAREGGRARQASYGHGTWLLGEEAALATLEDEVEEELEEGTQEDARKRLEERIRRYVQNQEVLRQSQSRRAEAQDPESFWARWSTASRAQWLLALYVESSGDFRLERIRFANCRECGGTGVREIAYTGSAISGQSAASGRIECPTCHGIARVRRVRYR